MGIIRIFGKLAALVALGKLCMCVSLKRVVVQGG